MGQKQYGIDPDRLSDYANEIKTVVDQKVQVAIVIGGLGFNIQWTIG